MRYVSPTEFDVSFPADRFLPMLLICSCAGPPAGTSAPTATSSAVTAKTDLTKGVVPENASPVIYKVGGDVKPPRAIKRVEVPYPEEMKGQSYELGVLILKAIIDQQGRVTNVEALNHRDHPLARRHIEALKKWQFEPATRNGNPVAAEFSVTVGHFPVRRANSP